MTKQQVWSTWLRVSREVMRTPLQAFRKPVRRRARGRYLVVQIPRELLTCPCRDEQPKERLFGIGSMLPHPTVTIHVWVDGTASGNCTHAECGQLIHRLKL